MRPRLLRMLLPFLLSFSAFAGEYADAFLLASASAQVQSMGLSAVALDLSNGIFLNNPAGFASLTASSASINYDQFGALSSNLNLEGHFRPGSIWHVGYGLVHSSVPELFFRPDLSGLTPEARRDSIRNWRLDRDDLIGYREDAAYVSLARSFEFEINLGWKFFKIPVRMPLGLTMKYIDKLLVENRGIGAGIDLGGQFYFSLRDLDELFQNTEFSLGLMLSDILNTPVYWETEHQDAIKRNTSFGYGISQSLQRFNARLDFSSSRQKRYPDQRQYGVQLSFREMLFLRTGHDGSTASFGLGIASKKFIIDYSFSRHTLSELQKIGIHYRF